MGERDPEGSKVAPGDLGDLDSRGEWEVVSGEEASASG